MILDELKVIDTGRCKEHCSLRSLDHEVLGNREADGERRGGGVVVGGEEEAVGRFGSNGADIMAGPPL